MSLLLSMLLLIVPLHAGSSLLEELDGPEMHYAICQQSARDVSDDPDRVTGVWKACLTEARRRGFEDLLPSIRGELSLAAAAQDAASRPDLDHAGRLEWTLMAVAVQHEVRFPLDTLSSVIRDYLVTDRGRTRLADYRDVSFRWTNRQVLTSSDRTRLDEILGRYVVESGLRWKGYGTQGGSEADIIVAGTYRQEQVKEEHALLQPLPRIRTVFAIEHVRFRKDQLRLDGFIVSADAEAADEQAAREECMHEAAKRVTAGVLHRIVYVALREVIAREELEKELREP